MANDLVLTESDNFYYFENVESVRSASSSSRSSKGKSQGNKGTGQLDISVRDDAFITVSAKDVPIADLIAGVSAELFKQYFKSKEGSSFFKRFSAFKSLSESVELLGSIAE